MEASLNKKDSIKRYNAKYYEKNKDKILNNLKDKIKCDICNSQFCKSGYYRHIDSRKHKYAVLIKNMQAKET